MNLNEREILRRHFIRAMTNGQLSFGHWSCNGIFLIWFRIEFWLSCAHAWMYLLTLSKDKCCCTKKSAYHTNLAWIEKNIMALYTLKELKFFCVAHVYVRIESQFPKFIGGSYLTASFSYHIKISNLCTVWKMISSITSLYYIIYIIWL